MGVLDIYFSNPKAIEDGFRAIFGLKKYILLKDMEDNLICVSYDMDACRTLIEEYLKRKGLDRTLFKFESKTIKNKSPEFGEIIPYKIVIFDGELALYKDVQNKAQDYLIAGYDGKLPKYGINKYKTISKP